MFICYTDIYTYYAETRLHEMTKMATIKKCEGGTDGKTDKCTDRQIDGCTDWLTTFMIRAYATKTQGRLHRRIKRQQLGRDSSDFW